jgi:hypothetical protein
MAWRLRYRRPGHNKTFVAGSLSLSESWAKSINERLPRAPELGLAMRDQGLRQQQDAPYGIGESGQELQIN